jgi:hypothetical protein
MGLDLLRQPAAPPLLLIATTASSPELLPSALRCLPACGSVNIWWNLVEKVKTLFDGQITPMNTYLLCNNQRHMNESDFSARRLLFLKITYFLYIIKTDKVFNLHLYLSSM